MKDRRSPLEGKANRQVVHTEVQKAVILLKLNTSLKPDMLDFLDALGLGPT